MQTNKHNYWVAAIASLLVVIGTVAFGPSASAAQSCHLIIVGNEAKLDGQCPADAKVATYKYKDGVAPGAPFDETTPQTLFDTGKDSASLPPCAYQADALIGDVIQTIDRDHLYGPRLIEGIHGGSVACTTTTTTTPTTQPPVTSVPTSVPTAPVQIGTAVVVEKVPTNELARTGINPWFLIIGGLLVLSGGVLVYAARNVH